MQTQCSATEIGFGRASGRRVVADFDGGTVSSDAGALLLDEADKAVGLTDRFAACFVDRRNPLMTVHALRAQVAQRVFGPALGYEDLNDHDDLRGDPVLGVLLGKLDRAGEAQGLLDASKSAALDRARPRRDRRSAARRSGRPLLSRLLRLHCYLPLYVFCGRHLLAAKLRRSDIDGSAGSVEEMERIVAQIRVRRPKVKIVPRADSSFAP